MAVFMSRCAPSLRSPAVAQRSQVQARPCKPVAAFGRCCSPRPCFGRPSAFYRTAGWDDASADAMKEVMADLARQWKAQQGNINGGIFWPGGGYIYKNGTFTRCKPSSSASSPDSASSSSPTTSTSLPLDVAQDDSFYYIYADVPGLSKPDLTIKLSKQQQQQQQQPDSSGKVITISGQRSAPLQEEDGVSFVSKQRRFGEFSAAWVLPADAQGEGISAKVTEGVLTVTVPKKQQQPEQDDSQEIFIN